jgi:autotransporter-associated beta strand protein
LSFYDFSGAGNAKINNFGTINFNHNSTAGAKDATIANSGTLNFNATSSAGDANIVNNSGGTTNFNTNSSAGNATITISGLLGLRFNDSSSAANAKITNNGGLMTFRGNSSAADAQIVNNAVPGSARTQSLTFEDFATATNATIINNDAATTTFYGHSSGGKARLVAHGGGAFEFGELESAGTTAGSIEGSGIFFLGSKTLTVGGNNLSTTVTGTIADSCAFSPCPITAKEVVGGSLVKEGTGTLTLDGINFYTGPTTVRQGALIVNGSIKSSSRLTVENGAKVGGTGVLPTTDVRAGGELSPGSSIGTLNVDGNVTLGPSSVYFVEFAEAGDHTKVTGTAELGGTLALDFLPRGFYLKNYNILHADGGFGDTTFSNVIPAPNFITTLTYAPNDIFLDVTPALGLGTALPGNASNVANSINGFFINNGTLPPAFDDLYDLTGGNLANALSQLSGEAATGAQKVGFQLTDQFLNLMLDPFVDGRSGVGGADRPALGFAPERDTLPPAIAHAYAAVLKAPPKAAPVYEPRWTVWGGAYGGANRTTGDLAVIGSHDLSASTVGFAGGLDYHLSRDSVVGLAFAGGGTNWSLAQGLGGGKSDAFQAGVYGATKSGPAYLAAAFAFANHWMSTDRLAFGDHLTADFNAQSYGGRLEGGYRFGTPYGGFAPYAAIQAQSFHTPGYGETGLIPNGFALAFNGRDATDTRSELGARFDRVLALYTNAVLALRGRVAWAHDWVSDPTLTPLFQTLPGASFIVNGALPAKDSALVSAGAEYRLANGLTLLGKFDGEFASRSSTYAGTGTVRYTW